MAVILQTAPHVIDRRLSGGGGVAILLSLRLQCVENQREAIPLLVYILVPV